MKLPLICIAVALANIAHATPLSRTVETLPSEIQRETKALNPEYLVFAPESEPGEPIPLLITLHGGGGRGEDIAIAEKRCQLAIDTVRQAINESFYIVVPQALKKEGASWFAADLNALLEHLKKTLSIDERRVYLTGHSMGGYGTWMWAASHPDTFAAAAPSAGGLGQGGPMDITPDLDEWARQLTGVPLWAFHGADDHVVPADRSERMVAAIREHGGKRAKLTVYPGVKHNSVQQTHANPELFEWMFRQRRSGGE